MKVLTCNVRCIVANDGPNHWAHRKHLCIETIRRQQPDLIGFQELWEPQQRDLAAALPEFAVFGTADEPTGRNAMNAIFYRRDRFALLS
ncbi:MAG: endonuclease/exonuclease/phosphatase, partial [Puniceicoccaceae bacterium]